MTITIRKGTETRTVSAQEGQSLLEVLRAAGENGVKTPCGGKGTCGKCTVAVCRNGAEACVLACQTPAEDGMTVLLPEEKRTDSVLLDGVRGSASADSAEGYGIACDIGTTTVVCRLVRLADGESLAVLGEGNRQASFGADVIARIQAATEGHLAELQTAITGQLSDLIRALCAQTGTDLTEVHVMAIAGNTTMLHLLTGLDPEGIGHAPFTPLSYFGDSVSARELDLPFDGAVYLCPAVSGYVGGDITADMLALDMEKQGKPVLMIDVGTNGEMALGGADRILCCSTAAGPAFEGAQITCGMTAGEGAVSGVVFENGEIRCSVIGGGEAKGICGSGLIDAIAVMLNLGAVDETGRMMDPEEDDDIPEEALRCLFLDEDENPAFRLTENVFVTQADVRKVQLGKGAIAAGEQVLIGTYGADYSGIGALLLAGGFGSFIRPASAARIGLIPEELLPVTSAVGNTAAEGARLALISSEAKERLAALKEKAEYIELSGMKAFNDAYMDAMFFPEE